MSNVHIRLFVFVWQTGKTADITPRKKARIDVYLKETAVSQQEIAKKVGVSQQTVSRLSRKLALEFPIDSQQTGNFGRKRKPNARSSVSV